MAEPQKTPDKKQEKAVKPAKDDSQKKQRPAEDHYESLVRIYGYDVFGTKPLYSGLTRIKGISWAISNAICLKLGIPRNKKISDLSKDEIAKIEALLPNLPLPDYLKNRRSDPETGKTGHLFGTDLDIARDFDIKRMKKIKSYKGIRHTAKLPVRGQRTRSHFRTKKGTGAGIKRKPSAPAAGGAK